MKEATRNLQEFPVTTSRAARAEMYQIRVVCMSCVPAARVIWSRENFPSNSHIDVETW